jgi:hypothetical protein
MGPTLCDLCFILHSNPHNTKDSFCDDKKVLNKWAPLPVTCRWARYLHLLVEIQCPLGYGTDLDPGRLVGVLYWPHVDRTHRRPDRRLYIAAASSGNRTSLKVHRFYCLQARPDYSYSYVLFGPWILRRRRFTWHWVTSNLYLNLLRQLLLNFSSMAAT